MTETLRRLFEGWFVKAIATLSSLILALLIWVVGMQIERLNKVEAIQARRVPEFTALQQAVEGLTAEMKNLREDIRDLRTAYKK